MKKSLTLIFVFCALIFASFYFDVNSEVFFRSLRAETIFAEPSIIFFTAIGIILAGIIIAGILFWRKKYETLILALIALFSALAIGYVLKMIFQVPRPEFDVRGPILARGYSFPSMHAIGAIAVLPFITKITKNKIFQITLAVIFIATPLSRLYLGVHRLSDVVFGAILGGFIGAYVIALEYKYDFAKKIVKILIKELEMRRQVAHLAAGLFIAILVFYNFLNWWIFAGILAFGIGFSVFLRYVKIPFFHYFQCLFDRQCDMKKFPGKGLIFMVAGCFAVYMLFPKNIAIASILTLAIGDSLTHIIGKYFGEIKSPFDKTKNIEGTVVAFFITALAIMKFVSFQQAIVATLIAMIIEMVPVRVFKLRIDDNLLMPIVAGAIMTML